MTIQGCSVERSIAISGNSIKIYTMLQQHLNASFIVLLDCLVEHCSTVMYGWKLDFYEPKESLTIVGAKKAALPSTSSALWGYAVRYMPCGMAERAAQWPVHAR